jgi:hypothetical protein
MLHGFQLMLSDAIIIAMLVLIMLKMNKDG